uniref:Solute carrier family 15 member 5 n=1 Tax=Pavo cristatus TaxID=9049 RepID=A0A8C9FI63_PAVCR
ESLTSFGNVQEKQLMADTEKEKSLLPGRRNHAGNLTLPEKKVQEAICVLLVELCERFTFFGIVCNMILFCTVRLGYRNYQAAIVNMCFVGTSMLTPVLAGWLAECLVGRIKLVCICMFLHFLGTALLPIVAFPFEDIYIDKRHILLHTLTKKEQKIVFYFALLTASLGIGGIRAIVCPLSAYNLENCGPKELLSFFNWFYWLINLNSAVVFVSISYIQQSVARNLGFLLPFVSVLMAMITIHMVRGKMIYKPKTDSSLLTTFGVIGSALKMCCVRYRYFSGDVSSWLDHAKEYHGGRYSETQVESTKSLARLFPLFAFQILYRTCIMQVSKQLFKPNLKKDCLLPCYKAWFLTVALPTEPPCRIVFISSNKYITKLILVSVPFFYLYICYLYSGNGWFSISGNSSFKAQMYE